jgi:hypothetical protein
MSDQNSRQLEREEEWYRIYSSPNHPRIYQSKLASGEASISLAKLRPRWEHWHQGERVQFSQAFGQKSTLDSEDELVLEFLMEQDDSRVCASVALLSTKHSDRSNAVRFLLRCVETFKRDRANFLHALSILADSETVPQLLQIYRSAELEILKNPQDNDSILNLLYSSVALFKILGQESYRDSIAGFLRHPNEEVRTNAYLCMQGLLK